MLKISCADCVGISPAISSAIHSWNECRSPKSREIH